MDEKLKRILDLFVKKDEIKEEGGKIIITPLHISPMRLRMVLQSQFNGDFDFEVDAHTLTLIPKELTEALREAKKMKEQDEEEEEIENKEEEVIEEAIKILKKHGYKINEQKEEDKEEEEQKEESKKDEEETKEEDEEKEIKENKKIKEASVENIEDEEFDDEDLKELEEALKEKLNQYKKQVLETYKKGQKEIISKITKNINELFKVLNNSDKLLETLKKMKATRNKKKFESLFNESLYPEFKSMMEFKPFVNMMYDYFDDKIEDNDEELEKPNITGSLPNSFAKVVSDYMESKLNEIKDLSQLLEQGDELEKPKENDEVITDDIKNANTETGINLEDEEDSVDKKKPKTGEVEEEEVGDLVDPEEEAEKNGVVENLITKKLKSLAEQGNDEEIDNEDFEDEEEVEEIEEKKKAKKESKKKIKEQDEEEFDDDLDIEEEEEVEEIEEKKNESLLERLLNVESGYSNDNTNSNKKTSSLFENATVGDLYKYIDTQKYGKDVN